MFYQLFGLSFWRHPFTAEDPLVSKWWNAKFVLMKKQTHLHLGWPEDEYIISKLSSFHLKTTCVSCRTRYWRPVSLARSRLLWSYLWQEGLWNAKLKQMYYLQLQYRWHFPCLYTDELVFSSVGFFTPLMRHLGSIPTTPLSPGSLCPTQTWSSTRAPWSAPYDPERWGLTQTVKVKSKSCIPEVKPHLFVQVLYFPDRWWHATLNLDTSVFISTFLGWRLMWWTHTKCIWLEGPNKDSLFRGPNQRSSTQFEQNRKSSHSSINLNNVFFNRSCFHCEINVIFE